MSETGKEYGEMAKIRRDKLTKERIEYAVKAIADAGFEPEIRCNNSVVFEYNGSKVIIFPFTGWFSGKTVEDGRGIVNLIKQIVK